MEDGSTSGDIEAENTDLHAFGMGGDANQRDHGFLRRKFGEVEKVRKLVRQGQFIPELKPIFRMANF